MSWHLGEDQLYECPEEFQERLNAVGGLNRYDEPNFRIEWSNNLLFRAGGAWDVDECPYVGYRWLRQLHDNCWVLLMWHPPEVYGTPESYYVQNACPDTGLQVLGEYPYSGKYEIVAPLVYRHVENGKMVTERMPLSSLLVDLVIPTILLAKDVGIAKRKAALLDRKAREDEEQVKAVGESLSKGRLAFGKDSVSYARQIGIESDLDRRVMRLKRGVQDALGLASRLNQGTFQK